MEPIIGRRLRRAGAKRWHDYKASRSEATAIACNLMARHWVAKKKENRKNRNSLQIFTGLIFLQAKKWRQLSESTRRAKPDEVPERSARHKLISEVRATDNKVRIAILA